MIQKLLNRSSTETERGVGDHLSPVSSTMGRDDSPDVEASAMRGQGSMGAGSACMGSSAVGCLSA